MIFIECVYCCEFLENKEFKRIDTLKGIYYKDGNIIVPILLDYRHESIVCGKPVQFAFTDKFAMHHESFKNSVKIRPKRFIGFLALGVSIVLAFGLVLVLAI